MKMTDIIQCPHCKREFPLVVVVKEKKESERPEKITTTQAPIIPLTETKVTSTEDPV